MKLVRFGPPACERPGVWLEDAGPGGKPAILDVRGMAFDLADYDAHFFAHGGIERVRALLAEPSPRFVDPDGLRLGAPVASPGKIMCLGKNYADHAAEFGGGVPSTPVVFTKAPTAANGPFDPILLPPQARTVDGEAELALVIGRRARHLAVSDALSCVAGYLVLNDVTDRDAQRAGQQWFYGKSPDTFCPLGPWLVTADEVADPHALRVFSRWNGEPLQEGRTSQMVFRIPTVLAYLSAAITLMPGDIVATGTPAGIGSARKPPRLLEPGVVLETGIEGLGTQRATVVREAGGG